MESAAATGKPAEKRSPATRIRFLEPGEGTSMGPLWDDWLGITFDSAMEGLDAGQLQRSFEYLECLMVIEDRATGDPYGLLLAGPPKNYLAGLPQHTALAAAQLVTKLSGIAVRPDMRGRDLGRKLLLRALAEYRQREYQWIYGQFEASPQLERFYRRLGFRIWAPGQTMIGPPVAGEPEFPANSPTEQWFDLRL